MSGLFTLANFLAFNAQIIAIVAAAALLLRLIPLPSAGVRYGAWRFAMVVALCRGCCNRRPGQRSSPHRPPSTWRSQRRPSILR